MARNLDGTIKTTTTTTVKSNADKVGALRTQATDLLCFNVTWNTHTHTHTEQKKNLLQH